LPSNVKIDVAVNAPEAGTITQWFVSEEDNVEVGQKLCEIDTEGKASSGGMFFSLQILNFRGKGNI
jgi:pyruvate/2-oxoglutarate dehydrogenase complex dihydrolipoamide acyltransferase (E2) component